MRRPSHRRTRVLVVDDHPIIRRGTSACLTGSGDFEIVGEAGNGIEALREAEKSKPDVVLMDLSLPKMDGLSATKVLRRKLPHIKVLISCMHRDERLLRRLVECGAVGFVLKTASPETLVLAVEATARGKSLLTPDAFIGVRSAVVAGLKSGLGVLTKREREVLREVAQGKSNQRIAEVLDLSLRKVQTHRSKLMRKLNIHTVAGLTKFALISGLTSLDYRRKGCREH